jgi:hypothetical protein
VLRTTCDPVGPRDDQFVALSQVFEGTIVVGGEKMGYFTPDGKPIEGLGRSGYGRPPPPIDLGELAAADEAPGAEE